MFYYLDGTVTELEPYLAVIDCGGVGYACHTTSITLSELCKGRPVKLYTFTYIREEIFDIYGFSTKNELNCFKLLIGISGVGPKAALSILSSNSPEKLAVSIISGDEKALTVAPGIGKKLAQRIILELKDKIAKEQPQIAGAFTAGAPAVSTKASDAAAALAVLGYAQSDIAAAMRNMDVESMTVEEIIRQVLKKMLPAS